MKLAKWDPTPETVVIDDVTAQIRLMSTAQMLAVESAIANGGGMQFIKCLTCYGITELDGVDFNGVPVANGPELWEAATKTSSQACRELIDKLTFRVAVKNQIPGFFENEDHEKN